ncbi:hypothetical protein, partial [Streptomyces sp. NPDC006368]|uniref:hypothetical protein n=1 Tax=Streptomyces sp. NPDC006368 TaxID=3156760 RepID=UPI0033BD7257
MEACSGRDAHGRAGTPGPSGSRGLGHDGTTLCLTATASGAAVTGELPLLLRGRYAADGRRLTVSGERS